MSIFLLLVKFSNFGHIYVRILIFLIYNLKIILKRSKHLFLSLVFILKLLCWWFYQEMGFPQSQSEVAIQAFGTVQAALEALLAGKGKG